ncbi:MAG: hypothetical protein V4506_15650 [Bacteroidota bacterium]
MIKLFTKMTVALTFILLALSFTGSRKKTVEFHYPKRDNTTITMLSDNYKKFNEEWKGGDYYYMSFGKDSIICSVLYYLLNENEQKNLVQPFGDAVGPLIPMTYFLTNSNMKNFEKNKTSWGGEKDDFMFRQADIINYQGYSVRQKNMYAYCIFGKDLFVNIHLSKTNYTTKDSTIMRQMLASFAKKK